MTPQNWYQETIGKAIDTDNYPRNNPYQCWDYFDLFCRRINFSGSRHCSSTGYVGDLWFLKDADGYNYSRAFEYITDPTQFKDGDWIFWSQHVAMYYASQEVGQNQPYPYVTSKNMKWDGILGALRWKGYKRMDIAYGASDVNINGHLYKLYRQNPVNEKIAVIGAGLNNVLPFEKFALPEIATYAVIGGANFFQMKEGQVDPVNTTYGDVSSPITGMYQNLPNQDTTLFYDLETTDFGDCAYHEVDRTHNVYSPALVYPNSNGHFEYARMVGLGHKDIRSTYTFCIRFDDGFCVGIGENLTPEEIATDFSSTEMRDIAFLDGGGSAQMGRWSGTELEFIRDTGRAIPSVLAIYRTFESKPAADQEVPELNPYPTDNPEETIPDSTEEDEGKEGEDSMNNNENTPVSPEEVTIAGQIAKLIDVKSIITFLLVGTLCWMVTHGMTLEDKYMTIVTMVCTFYFSYQVKKG